MPVHTRAKKGGKVRRKAQEGGKTRRGTSSDETLGTKAFNTLGNLGFQLRFGMSPEEKQKFASSGVAAGLSPEEAAGNPLATRAASSFLGTSRFGTFLPALFGELRQQFNVGGGDEDNEAFREALIQGASRAVEAENLRGKAGDPKTPLPPSVLEQVTAPIRKIRSRTGETTMPGRAQGIRGSKGGRTPRKVPRKRLQEPGQAPPVPQPPSIDELMGQPGFLEFIQQLFSRQQGATGGRVVPDRGPRAHALVGGFSPTQERQQEQRIEDISANTGTLDSIVGNLRNFQAGGSDIISQLRSFSPFSDIGQGTLDQMLQTGLPTDVSGITQAAQIRGRQEFDDAQDVIGERLANLGLTSSTARTAAVGRERGRLGERVAAAGLEAGVGAQESARQRQLAALGLDVQGGGLRGQALSSAGGLQLQRSGQRLAGKQSALGGAAQSSRLGLDALLGRAGAGNQFLSTLGSGGGGSRQFGGGRSSSRTRSGGGNRGARFSTGAGAASSPVRRANTSTRRQPIRSTTRTGQTGNRTRTGAPISSTGNAKIFGFAEGGRVEAARGGEARDPGFENFLQRFGADLFQGGRTNVIPPDASTERGKEAFRQRALAALGGEDIAQQLFQNPSQLSRLAGQATGSLEDPSQRFGVGFEGPRNRAQAAALGVGQEVAPANIRGGLGTRAKADFGIDPSAFVSTPLDFQRSAAAGNVAAPPPAVGGQTQAEEEEASLFDLRSGQRQQFLGGPDGASPLDRQGSLQRRGFQEGGPAEEPVPKPGGVPQPSLPQELGQQVPGILDPRRQFFDEGGGAAPGQDDGTDKIPALLRSEEVVVTPDIVQAIETANPNQPNPDLIMALQELAQKPLQFNEGEGEFEAQAGGTADPRGSFADFLASLFQGQQEGISPETTPELFGQAPLRFEAAPEQPSSFGTLGPPDPFTQLPGAPTTAPEFAVPAAEPIGPTPAPPLRELQPSTFEQGVGEAGERTFTLSGGDPGAPGAAIQVEGGPATGGFGAPRGKVRPGLPRGGGTVSSPQITLPSGQPLRDTIRSQTRLESAQNRASLLQSALLADKVGGPEKQARLMQALQTANREVDSAVNEIVASENVATRRRESEARIFDAKARLNVSISRNLQDEAQRATANSPLAKELIEAAAQSEQFAQLLNIFETQAKFKDMSSDQVAQLDALAREFGQKLGFQFSPNGNIAQLLGAPAFDIVPNPAQEGIPGAPGVEDNTGIMTQTEQQLNPEAFQILNQLGVGLGGDFLGGIPTGS